MQQNLSMTATTNASNDWKPADVRSKATCKEAKEHRFNTSANQGVALVFDIFI